MAGSRVREGMPVGWGSAGERSAEGCNPPAQFMEALRAGRESRGSLRQPRRGFHLLRRGFNFLSFDTFTSTPTRDFVGF